MRIALHREVGQILTDSTLGPIALSLFTHGLSQGMTIPLITLWIAGGYRGGSAATAAYFACTALGGLVLNPWLGRIADHWGRPRHTAAIAAGLQSAGLVVLALNPAFWIVLLAATCLTAAQMQPHLFSLTDGHVGAGRVGRGRGVTMATLRSMVSAAWVFGAPLGGALAGGGYGRVFLLAAAINAASAVCTLVLCTDAPHARAGSGAAQPGRRALPPAQRNQLILFGAAALLVVAGNSAKMQAVPLYLARLGLSPALVGVSYSWMALGELLLMPPVGRLADRMSRRNIIALGTLGGTAFFAAIALVPGPLAVLVAFPAISFLIAALYGVGIGYAQDLAPEHPGLAGGMFFAAQGLGSAAGGPLIAFGAAAYGLPHAFLLPAAAIILGCAGFLLTRPVRDYHLHAGGVVGAMAAGD